MKITTTKEKLLSAVIISERVTGKKEALPILSCVLLDVGRGLAVRATNLEAGVEIQVHSDVEEGGQVAVPASVFSQTLRSINSEKITLGTDGGNLVVETKGTRTLIKAVPHDEFPKLSVSDNKIKRNEVPRDALLRGVQAVLYAASASMIRPELGSVCISIKDELITCVATDSFRLAEKKVKGSSGREEGEILLPLKHAGELVYLLERIPGETVSLNVSDSQLIVSSGGTQFVSRVIEGTFPNYQEVIPKTFATEATVLKNDLAETLRKARVFSGDEQYIGLHIYPKKKIFSATAQSADVGEMSDSIDAAVSGEDIDINFHIGYLSDCLSSIDSDSIVLAFGGVGKPLVLRGVSDSSFMYLVMPLNR